ncbi:scavenger receptor class B member 1 [Condylostylus longicornis]|uniref:scavenger receptor class B member 1 n=1 Tax=Condylostylus longicornis TaxID=2530218 RepID=UPI00244DE78A|nr:scavenger receptor class B member 1 [Condylostylus longicornis]
MKDFKKFFAQQYSAVNTKDELNGPELNKVYRMNLKSNKKYKNSINVVDSFFNKRKPGKTTRSPKCGFLLLAGGLIAIVTGILVGIYHPYDVIFKWKLKFGEGGEIFTLWEKPPVDLYIKIYLFNITNPNEYLAGKEKIKVEEVGPYVYKEYMSHDEIVFNDNGTVSTIPRHPLVWQEHLSQGNHENDTVQMLNIALLSIAQVGADKSYLFRLPINLLIRQTNSQPIVKMTAREFMFGFETSLTTIGNTFLSDWIYFDKVGLIDRMYDFSEDFETFYTGETDSSLSGLYDTYMGSKNLPQWDGEHCSNIEKASDGAKFKSFLQANDTVKFFRKSMCRSQYLVRDPNEIEVNGFRAYKYSFEENAMDNGEVDERNKCFCKKGYCPPKGLLDVSSCYYGFPIALSYPHFLDSDTKLIDNVDGMEPDASKHSSYFVIQPESGLPLKISAKFQINMHFRDIRSMARVGRFSHQTIPMLWFDISLNELPEPLRNRFNLYLNILPHIDTLGLWIPIVGGIICVLCTIVQATLNLPQFVSSTSKKLASSNKNSIYSKNILRSDVYNPCEVKLLELKENNVKNKNIKNQTYGQYDNNIINCDNYENSDAVMYQIDLPDNNNSNDNNRNEYALENEPVISDYDCSSKSNFSSRSTSSQELSSESNNIVISVESSSDIENINSNSRRNSNDFDKQIMQNRLIHRNDTNSENSSSRKQFNSNNNLSEPCLLGETSSSIEDIGVNQFTVNSDDFSNTNNDPNKNYNQYEKDTQQLHQEHNSNVERSKSKNFNI